METTDNIVPARAAILRSATITLKALPSIAPVSHWAPYVCLFLYPIVVLQIKAGGDVALGLLFISGIYALVKSGSRFHFKKIRPLYACLTLFWLVDFLTAAFSRHQPMQGMLSSFTQIHFLLFPVFVAILSRLQYSHAALLIGVATSIFIASIVSVYQYLAIETSFATYFRAHGGINAIIFANVVLVQSSVMAVYAFCHKKLWCWGIVSLGCVVVVMSLTQGAILAMLALFVLLLFFIPWKKLNWAKLRVLCLPMLVILIGLFPVYEKVGVKVERTYNSLVRSLDGIEGIPTSSTYRLAMYKGGVELASANPWFGVGRENVNSLLNTTSVMNDKLEGITQLTHLHNEYLTTLAGSGIVGLVSLLVLLISPCLFIFRYTSKASLCGQVLVVCILYAIYGLTNLAFDNGTLNGVFVVVLASAFSRCVNICK